MGFRLTVVFDAEQRKFVVREVEDDDEADVIPLPPKQPIAEPPAEQGDEPREGE